MRKDPAIHQIAVLVLAPVVAFDLAIPMQVFGHEDRAESYRVRLCGPAPGEVPTTTGFPIVVSLGLGALRTADTVIVPGFALGVPVPTTVRRALASAHRRGARMVSICTGAFALADAGILDGRPATTHWHHCAQLAEQFPAVSVDPRVLYVDDGPVLTSAGMLAGLDLCLHLIARDHGEAAAVAVARRMVAPLHRAGGQAQFIPGGSAAQSFGSSDVSDTLHWARRRLDQPLTVAAMARHAVLSPRSFHRAVRAQTGTSPHDWLTKTRLGTACALLEDPSVSVDEVARRSGLGTAANLRLHFQRTFATTPTAYRSTFAG
jgi:AraC family transcriptional regulator, transcriptional activator FtrA